MVSGKPKGKPNCLRVEGVGEVGVDDVVADAGQDLPVLADVDHVRSVRAEAFLSDAGGIGRQQLHACELTVVRGGVVEDVRRSRGRKRERIESLARIGLGRAEVGMVPADFGSEDHVVLEEGAGELAGEFRPDVVELFRKVGRFGVAQDLRRSQRREERRQAEHREARVGLRDDCGVVRVRRGGVGHGAGRDVLVVIVEELDAAGPAVGELVGERDERLVVVRLLIVARFVERPIDRALDGAVEIDDAGVELPAAY